MKPLMKKFAAVLIAGATMLGVAGLGAASATAADNAELTVSTADSSFASKTINAYKMFSATVSADGAIAYELNTEWEAFFTSQDLSGLADCDSKTGTELSACAYTEVAKLGESSTPTIDTFARQASNWAQAKKTGTNPATSNATVAKTATISDSADAQNQYTASFTGLDFGYYLIAVPGVGNTTATTNKYATLIPVTTAAGTTAQIKGSLPTVDKKITTDNGDADSSSAKIGDTVTFTLTSTIPDMSAYDSYTFNFHDYMGQGLTFKSVTSVVVQGGAADGGDATLEQGNDTDPKDYTITEPNQTIGNKVIVTMNDFKNKQQKNAGKKIIVTYTATINENAVVGGLGNMNGAVIEYSNNPLTEGKGESTIDKVYVYTYQFGIDKYTVKDAAQPDAHTQLAGAKFTLTAKNSTDAIKFVVDTQGDATKPTKYRVAKDANEAGATTELVTPDSGRIDLTGLALGEYVLEETAAPSGYNKLQKKLGVKVDGTKPTDGQTNATTTITFNRDADNTTYDQTTNNGIIGIENTTGPTLPSTGGMGTILFTIFGVLIIIGGAAWYVKSNRKTSRHSA